MAGSARGPAIYIISSLSELTGAVKKSLPNANIIGVPLFQPGVIAQKDEDDLIKSAEVLLADLPYISKYIGKANKLKWCHSTWAGVETIIDQIDTKEPPDVILSRPGTAFGDLMAEYVLGQILAKEKNIPKMYVNHHNKVWNPNEFKHPRLLSSLKLGVLGAGHIGTAIGSLCKAVGMEVWGMTREKKTDKSDLPLDVYKTCDDLPQILENCDYLCNVLPSTPSTRDLLSGDMLKHCKDKKSIFINVGRGDVIDQDSLVNALKNGWISGAILDVFKMEPLPQESPLWTLPNVLVTPHISGPSHTELVMKSFIENYNKYINKEDLSYTVDWKRGY